MTDAPDPKPAPSALSRLLSGGRAGVAALAVSIVALVISLAPYASGTDFGSRVRAYLVQNPEVLQEVSDALTAPEVLRMMQAHPDVRFVFKDWPILDGPSNGVSHYAARAAQAAHRQGKYLPVFRDLMAEPALSEAAIDAILEANGVAMDQARAKLLELLEDWPNDPYSHFVLAQAETALGDPEAAAEAERRSRVEWIGGAMDLKLA